VAAVFKLNKVFQTFITLAWGEQARHLLVSDWLRSERP